MIERVIEILENYLGDELKRYTIRITPQYFKMYYISHKKSAQDLRVERQIRDIIGYNHCFEYIHKKGAFLWKDFPYYKKDNIDFRFMHKNIELIKDITKISINLNTDHGILKKAKSNHEKLTSDGYIMDENEIANLDITYRFLTDGEVRFLRNDNSTLFFKINRVNYSDYQHGGDFFPWIIIPNNIING